MDHERVRNSFIGMFLYVNAKRNPSDQYVQSVYLIHQNFKLMIDSANFEKLKHDSETVINNYKDCFKFQLQNVLKLFSLIFQNNFFEKVFEKFKQYKYNTKYLLSIIFGLLNFYNIFLK